MRLEERSESQRKCDWRRGNVGKGARADVSKVGK
jgi:hypothetical protein